MKIIKLSYKEIRELKSKCSDDVILHLNRASSVKRCKFCGNLYSPTHHKQVYCTKSCSKKAHQEQKNKWKRENYVEKQKLGTGYIMSEHRNKDFNKEQEILKKELRRLGIKR